MPQWSTRKSGRVELQPATMNIDRNLESFPVPKSVSPFLDGLDLGVQPFARGIGGRMRDVGQNTGEMSLDRMGNLSHWLQAAMDGPPLPALPEGLFFSGFPLPDGIHGFSHMAHDMVPVKDDLLPSLGNMPESGLEEGIPHIHGDRPDPGFSFGSQCLVERLQSLGLSALSYVFDRPIPKVAHKRHVLVSLGKRLFVHSDVAKRPFSFSDQSPFHFPLLAPSSLIPGDAKKGRHIAQIASLQNIDRQILEQLGEPSPGMGIRKKLTAVQVSPDPLFGMLKDRRFGSIFRKTNRIFGGCVTVTSIRYLSTSINTDSTLHGGRIPRRFWYSSVSLIAPPMLQGFINERNHGISFAPMEKSDEPKFYF